MILNNFKELIDSIQLYYLSLRELKNLELQILSRKQVGEEFQTFSSNLGTLIRRHGNYTAEKELEMLYWNMLSKYRLHIQQNDITVNGLL